MSKMILEPTKRTLIEMLERFPVPDDARVNVSLGNADICLAVSVELSPHPDPTERQFLINFFT